MISTIDVASTSSLLAWQPPISKKRAGEQFKKVTVLHDMPADQMGKVMNLMSEALGVRCSYCHAANDFSAEGIPHKDTAREMLQMTFDLNEKHFAGSSLVTCMTCHRGHAKPDPTKAHSFLEPLSVAQAPIASGEALSLPSVQEIYHRYEEAMGGRERLAAMPARHLYATRIEPDGTRESEEIWQAGPERYRLDTRYGTFVVSERVADQLVAKLANDRPIELHEADSIHIRRDAAFAWGKEWGSLFRSLVVETSSPTDGYVLTGIGNEGMREQLVFDRQVGLLRRRRLEIPTVLGPYAVDIKYDDYRVTEGISIPWRVEYRMPSIRWVREVERVEWNVEIDASTFRVTE